MRYNEIIKLPHITNQSSQLCDPSILTEGEISDQSIKILKGLGIAGRKGFKGLWWAINNPGKAILLAAAVTNPKGTWNAANFTWNLVTDPLATTQVLGKYGINSMTPWRNTNTAAAELNKILGNSVTSDFIFNLANASVKYALPVTGVIALLYGGKKFIDYLNSKNSVSPGEQAFSRMSQDLSTGNKEITESNKTRLAESIGRIIRGMLVQTPDQFVRSKGIKPKLTPTPTQDLGEELAPGEQPIRFAPSFKASYSQQTQEPDASTQRPYAKAISPDEVARLVHHKNTYVIYYEYKSPDDPSKIIEKRITTEPIYIPQNVVQQTSERVAREVEMAFPNATKQNKKLKVYVKLTKELEDEAVRAAMKSSPEVKYVLDNNLLPLKAKLKAKQFTTTGSKGKNPSVHRSSVPILNDEGQIIYDLDGLANRIMQRPSEVLKVNAKMKKSTGEDIRMANIGIPAIAGLVVDEKTKQFMIINTCPGAGQCKEYCYATRGGYVQYSASSESQARTLNYWYNDPEGFKNQVIQELSKLIEPGVKVYLRWHDSGDFFDEEYLRLAFDVANKVPEATIYAYTKIAKVAQHPNMPKNFLINFSQGAKPQETKQIDYTKVKHSVVVPAEWFKDEKTTGIGLDRLKERNPEAQQKMKEVIAVKYKVPLKSVITYDEMMEIPETDGLKYNVIIVPNLDGDLGAARRDVLGSYLLYH